MKLELVELTKTYRRCSAELAVIERLSWRFPEEGSVAILGRSGIGKSTLLYLLGGLLMPTSGEVRYGDVDLARLNSDELAAFRGRELGFVFQFHHLLPEFNAWENVALPLIISGESETAARRQAVALLDRVGLVDRLDHRPAELSGGEQQRVALARALVAEPGVLLADEPTGNLDAGTATDVQSLLLEINREQHSLMLVVTHNRELAESMDVMLEMLPGGTLQLVGASDD